MRTIIIAFHFFYYNYRKFVRSLEEDGEKKEISC